MNLLRRDISFAGALALAAIFLGCAGEDLTLPSDARPTHIEVITGNAQAGIAGAVLPLPVVVKLTDELGRPVVGQPVEFTVTLGGGSVSPGSSQTDTEGRASATWTLGSAAGPQGLEARATGSGASDDLQLDFTATAVPGSGSLLGAVSGDDQRASVNSTLAESLVVRASDGTGNPVSGVTVRWSVQGGGSITPETVVTGDDGLAGAERVLGPTAGQQSAQAASDGLAGSPVTFVHTAVASTPAELQAVSGNGQAAPAGFAVAEDLVVRLVDGDGNGVGGRSVTWVVSTGGGTVSPVNATTDGDGLARTRWTLGSSVGPNTLDAVFSGLPAVPFTATASADAPSKLAMVDGNGQSGTVGQNLGTQLSVRVTDENDNPVENVSVDWVAGGGGSVSSPTSGTGADGVARITRKLGTVPGPCTTTASVTGLAGSPVTFTCTANAGAAAKLAIVDQPGGTARSGSPLAPQPAIQVQDAQGNPVGRAGLSIAAELASPSNGAVLTGARTKATDANGRAAFTDLVISGPAGSYRLQFSGPSLPSVTSSSIALSAGAVSASRSSVEASPATRLPGETSTITVTARDGSGNPIAGAAVTLDADGAGNTVGQPSGTTNSSGVATGTFSSTGSGVHTISAHINGTPIDDKASVAVGAGPVSASRSSVAADPGQIPSGGSSKITVTALDAGGTPIAGAGVVLTADGAGNSFGQASGPTNGSGVFTTTFSATGLGLHTISASIDNTSIDDKAGVTVTVGSVSASRSEVAASPPSVPLGTPSTITVTARDAGGNLIPGAAVTLTADGTGNTFGQASGTTSSAGVFTTTFSSTSLGLHAIIARINNTPVDDHAGVIVTVGDVSASRSDVAASPSSVASGAPSTVTVTARDAGGNPIAGAAVTLSADGTGNSIGQPSSSTNSSGVATGTFSSTGTGLHTISARINNTPIDDKATVTVAAPPVSGTRSTVGADPGSIAAGATGTITVTALDAAGNPVPGANVTLSVAGGDGTFGSPGPTNASGVTTATFRATHVGDHDISARINGVDVADGAVVTIVAGPLDELDFVQQPTQTQAGQLITPAPTVSAGDQFGNPVDATITVSLNQFLSQGTLSGTLSVATVNGVATFSDLSVSSTGFFYSLTATSGGVDTSSVTFSVTP